MTTLTNIYYLHVIRTTKNKQEHLFHLNDTVNILWEGTKEEVVVKGIANYKE